MPKAGASRGSIGKLGIREASSRLQIVGSGLRRRLDPIPDVEQKTVRVAMRDGPNWNEPQPVRSDTFEIGAAGFDENLQLAGSDPWGTSTWSGLRVPGDATPSPQRRYLFMLAWLRLDANRWGRVRGIRTAVTLGVSIPSTVSGANYVVEQEVQNPFWKLTSAGNVCFHLRRIPSPAQALVFNTLNGPSTSYRYANGPALIYQSLAPYIPPGNAIPPGVALSAGLGTWYDGRFSQFQTGNAQSSVDIAVRGPCDVALFASVMQMPQVKPVPPPETGGLPPDDAFLMNFPAAQFWRVSGSIVWQEDTAK